MENEVLPKGSDPLANNTTTEPAPAPSAPEITHDGKYPNQAPPGPAQPKHGNHRGIMIGAIVVVIALLAVGIVPRIHQQAGLNQSTAAVKQSHPIVNLIRPTLSPATHVIDLPGTIEAVEQTAIDARATGYVSKVLVDIGDHAAAGQTLAIISAPDTDQQTAQGRAQLVQSQAAVAQAVANLSAMRGTLAQQQANLGHAQAAYLQTKAAVDQDYAQLSQAEFQYKEQQHAVAEQVANTNLAQVTYERNQNLYLQGGVAKQTLDQAAAAYKVDLATLSYDQSALAASGSNIKSYQENVVAGKANAAAAVQDIHVAQAEVATSVSNIHAAQASIAAAQATVAANQAALTRLVVLQNYEKVTAPFAGIVTARDIDPGAYISAGGSSGTSSVGSSVAGTTVSGGAASGSSTSGSGSTASSPSSASSSSGGGSVTPLFTIASIDRLRIYLNLPQTDADTIQVGQTATITARALPLQHFAGRVTQSAIALDPTSRTLVTEVQLANPGGVLRPGMFGDVKVTVPQAERILMIPDPAILTGPSGPQVVVVNPDNTIHFQNVTIGQDNGKTMQILSGLKATDHIVAAPNYGLVEGEEVQAQRSKKGKGHGRPS